MNELQLDISTAEYRKDPITGENVCIFIVEGNGKQSFVPLSERNPHYAEIMRQVEAGTLTIAEAD